MSSGHRPPRQGARSPSPRPPTEDTEKEQEGLLSGAPSSRVVDPDTPHNETSLPLPTLLRTALLVIFILILGLVVGNIATRYYKGSFANRLPESAEIPQVAMADLSNGTHDFKKTVLVVSLDGLRADYIDRGLTPHLFEISRVGLRAQYMKPVFPTLTFPNHWSLMTGLHAESHGIVANDFWDPAEQKEFVYTDPERSWDAAWWSGEPMWATADKAGIISANLMWPGPPITKEGHSPTYWVPWKDRVSLHDKLDQVFAWLDYPIDARPQLINAYSPDVDQMGHLGGPDSVEVLGALKDVDEFARDLHAGLKARNLTDIVSIIIVSDHGMESTSNIRLVYLDDVLGEELVDQIAHEDGWPNVGLRFNDGVNISSVLQRLRTASDASDGAFKVYTHDDMPERFHFANHHRIAPIYLTPHLGWAITNHHEHEVIMNGDYVPKGNHGYDNDESSMHAIFVADGPFAKQMKDRRSRRWLPNRSVDDLYIIEGFANVELYELVCKLLDMTPAPNNGTAGFWDKYF